LKGISTKGIRRTAYRKTAVKKTPIETAIKLLVALSEIGRLSSPKVKLGFNWL
jgi:hypothetical protein